MISSFTLLIENSIDEKLKRIHILDLMHLINPVVMRRERRAPLASTRLPLLSCVANDPVSHWDTNR
jgi:hypothetical protein